MTDNTQLDEILEDFYDGDIRQSDMGKAKQLIIDWHNKQVLELLDRLEAQFVEEVVVIFGETKLKKQVPLSAIEAERNKLKENADE